MSEKELNALCGIWQRRLRLQDWDVKVRLVRERDLHNSNNQGECEWSISTKAAVVRIIDPVDYSPDCAWPQDMERVLVHELLHLHFAPFSAECGTAEDVAQEQAIHALSQALVELARRSDEYGHRGHLDNDN